MENFLILLVLYIFNIFLARELNKKLIEKDFTRAIGIWFIPIAGPIVFGIVLLIIYYDARKQQLKKEGKVTRLTKIKNWFLLEVHNEK